MATESQCGPVARQLGFDSRGMDSNSHLAVNLIGFLGPFTSSQPHLPHRVVVRTDGEQERHEDGFELTGWEAGYI